MVNQQASRVIKTGTFARTMAWLLPIVALYKFTMVKQGACGRRWNPLTPRGLNASDPRLAEDLEVIRRSVF